MRTLSDSLRLLPFTSSPISSSLSYLPALLAAFHFLLPWCCGLQPRALPLRSWVTRTTRRLMSSSLRSPWLKTSDITIGQTLLNASRRRADHSEGEGLSSCMSSSMSHNRTGKSVVCRDASHAKSHEIQRQASESEHIHSDSVGPTKGANPRWLSSTESKNTNSRLIMTEEEEKIKLNDRVEARRTSSRSSGRTTWTRSSILHEQLLKQNWDLREIHEKSLNEMEELKRFQGSTFDEISRRN